MVKKAIFLILSLGLIVKFALPVFAVDDDSGRCVGGATYTFTSSNGNLVISGSGSIDYTSQVSNLTSCTYVYPWHSYKSYIKSVIIGSAISYIAIDAFSGCSSLTSVTYSGTRNPGQRSAFNGCDNLYCLLVPTSYTSDTFCGHSVVKGNACPAPTRSRSPMATPTPTSKFTAPVDYFRQKLKAIFVFNFLFCMP